MNNSFRQWSIRKGSQIFVFILTLGSGLAVTHIAHSSLNQKPRNISRAGTTGTLGIHPNQNLSGSMKWVKKNRFERTRALGDASVISFFAKFQNAVANDRRREVASMMKYPAKVNFRNDRLTRPYRLIKNEKEFIKNFDKILNPEIKSFIESVDIYNEEHVWENGNGIAVGRGVIWIGVYCRELSCYPTELFLRVRTIHTNAGLLNIIP